MEIKRSRRRIIVKPLTKIKCLVHPNGIKEQVSCDNLIEEGPLLFYLKPHDEYTPLQPNVRIIQVLPFFFLIVKNITAM